MAKKNLLEIVNTVLENRNEETVNALDDHPLAQWVAGQAEILYIHLITSDQFPHTEQLCQLESVSDSTKPSHLRVPDDVQEIKDIRYDVREESGDNPDFKEIHYRSPEWFLDHSLSKSDNSNVSTTDVDGVTLYITNDTAPKYWTTFDDEYIIFDAIDNGIDSTLQGSKSIVQCVKEPSWTESETFTPDLPSRMVPLFLAELTRATANYQEDQESPVDARRIFEQDANMSTRKSRTVKPKRAKVGYR